MRPTLLFLLVFFVGTLLVRPCTTSGWSLLVALASGTAALATTQPWRRRLLSAFVLTCSVALLSCLYDANYRAVRLTQTPAPSKSEASPSLPSASVSLKPVTALGSALVDEEPIALLGARAALASGRIPPQEARTLLEVLKDGYRRMKDSEGRVPTPVASWMLGLEPHTLIVEAEQESAQSRAVVFLHGWGGSWALPCWQVAQAARQVGAITVCPSTRFEGDWWSAQGEQTVRATLQTLRSWGIRQIVLVGLSNGGVGASLLAPKLVGLCDGLVLLSGVSAQARRSGVPTLVVHGRQDHLAPLSAAQQYVRRNGAKGHFLSGTHFVLLEEPQGVTVALATFLRALGEGSLSQRAQHR